LVLLFRGICFGSRHSGDYNTAQGKIEFSVARFADTAVLHFRRVDNRKSYGKAYKQMSVADICGRILFLYEDIPRGKEQINILCMRFGAGHNRFGRIGLGIDAIVRIHTVATRYI
jgi:hypothetical protein